MMVRVWTIEGFGGGEVFGEKLPLTYPSSRLLTTCPPCLLVWTTLALVS